jgi:prephenate dehydratase
VVPIENLVSGTVRENYDLLLEHDLVVAGEVVVPVRLCLAALPGQSLADIDRVYSHIQALGQAEDFLRLRPWTLLTTYNTAGAAKMIVDRGERAAGAVLSPRAAAVFGLETLAEEIQQVPDNRTRFLVIARPESATAVEAEVARAVARGVDAVLEGGSPGDGPRAAGTPPSSGRLAPRMPRSDGPRAPGFEQRHGGGTAMRTTMVVAVRNEPGSLHRCLGAFARADLNMSKLESRPSRDRAWEYVFWVDLDADAGQAQHVAGELQPKASMVRILGTYPRAVGG